jgi:hypothetical protein
MVEGNLFKGGELFKRLCAVYCVARAENYWTDDGYWRLEQLEVDLELITANRRDFMYNDI